MYENVVTPLGPKEAYENLRRRMDQDVNAFPGETHVVYGI